jgi:hypothetical protein
LFLLGFDAAVDVEATYYAAGYPLRGEGLKDVLVCSGEGGHGGINTATAIESRS